MTPNPSPATCRLKRVIPLLVSALTLVIAGCAWIPRSTAPVLPTLRSPESGNRTSDTLVVFLPGRGGTPQDFVRHGLVEELRLGGVRADWVAVDAHLGYYFERNIVTRLAADVLRPARAAGYRRIVVAGVSLGGLGALLTLRTEPELIDTVVLIAPYLGDDGRFFAELAGKGGARLWAAQAGEPRAEGRRVEPELWSYLGSGRFAGPRVWMVSGESDYLREGQTWLAPLLPNDQVIWRPGGHEWTTWRALWRELVQSTALFHSEREAASEADQAKARSAP